jgi:hypothetical protein
MRAAPAQSLARFQDAFALALREPEATPMPEIAMLAAQPAFAVYRNTVMKGCIDALQANYPAVTRIVGEEWMRAAAAVYARQSPPSDPALLDYGAAFADFLETFKPAAELPYLASVARLDRFWNEAHVAPDGPVLDPAALAEFAPEALAGAVLIPHASARWRWFAEMPVHTIWSRNRGNGDAGADLEWRPEGALVVRPHDAVVSIEIDASACAFLDACAAGCTLDRAAQAALKANGNADLTQLMSTLLQIGAFGHMQSDHQPQPAKEQP